MRVTFAILLFFMATTAVAFAEWEKMSEPRILEMVSPTINQLAGSVDDLPAERRKLLDQGADFIAARLAAEQEARLTFICTHNSRRSHLAQTWAQVAADYYQLPNIKTYSGGTETTACNIRTINALRRTGMQVVAMDDSDNPIYLLQYAENRAPLRLFSKIYNHEPNPQQDYAAMMCCSDVDEKCPVVQGAVERIPLHYVDPKISDDTAEEAETYDQRSQQIGREMFYMFEQAAKQLEASSG